MGILTHEDLARLIIYFLHFFGIFLFRNISVTFLGYLKRFRENYSQMLKLEWYVCMLKP
jgi:hypothetical protein